MHDTNFDDLCIQQWQELTEFAFCIFPNAFSAHQISLLCQVFRLEPQEVRKINYCGEKGEGSV